MQGYLYELFFHMLELCIKTFGLYCKKLPIMSPPEHVIKTLLECCTLMVSCSQNPTNNILESHLCMTIFKGIDLFFLIAFLNCFLGSMRLLYSLITENLPTIIPFWNIFCLVLFWYADVYVNTGLFTQFQYIVVLNQRKLIINMKIKHSFL